MSKPWDVAKEGLGFIGAVAIAIPWIRDFFARYTRDRLRNVNLAGGLRPLRDRLVARLTEWIDKPKQSDFVYMLIGLALLASGFAIGLWRGLFIHE